MEAFFFIYQLQNVQSVQSTVLVFLWDTKMYNKVLLLKKNVIIWLDEKMFVFKRNYNLGAFNLNHMSGPKKKF